MYKKHSRFAFLATLALFACQVASGQSGPIAHWKLDEGTGTSTADASGNGITGTLGNSPVWIAGRVNGALDFGATRYVDFGTPTSMSNLQESGMTVAAWIRPESAGGGNSGRIIDKRTGGVGWFLRMNTALGLRFDGYVFSTAPVSRISTNALTQNNWHHVAVTWTGSSTGTSIHFYINGILADSTATDGSGAVLDDSAAPVWIGNRSSDSAAGHDGRIDNLLVYNRVLTSTEIQALADTTAPSVPASLAATPANTQATLSWTASTDNVAVVDYLVERCTGAACSTFAEVGTSASASFLDTGLTVATTYRYRIRARDANTNKSAYSSILDVTTTATDTQAPSVPTGITGTPYTNWIQLNWTASTDNVGVVAYELQRCSGAGCSSYATVAYPTTNAYTMQYLTPGATYRFRLKARDAVPLYSAWSSGYQIATLPSADTTAPSVPGSLTATAVSMTQIDLTWAASTDNVAVTGYSVERCADAACSSAVAIGTPTATSFSDTGRTMGTQYWYRVRARDAVPNWSAFSSIATATTVGDTTAPTVPTGIVGTPYSNRIQLNWTASTDDVGVVGYEVQRCTGVGCTSFALMSTPTTNSYNMQYLAANTTYRFRIKARDAVPRSSAWSSIATFTTLASSDTQAPSTPTGLSITTGQNQLTLSWTASTDNVGVTAYVIERCSGTGCADFAQIDSVATTSYVDTGAPSGQSYSYRVRARDAAGNVSSPATSTGTPAACD